LDVSAPLKLFALSMMWANILELALPGYGAALGIVTIGLASAHPPNHHISPRAVLFDATNWDSYPECSRRCIIDKFSQPCGSASAPIDYSQCVCREFPALQNETARCVAQDCPTELHDTAQRFVDDCANTNNGGAKLSVDGWMAQGWLKAIILRLM